MTMTRRLAAIMYTDIAGFTPLTQQDEKAALRLLQEQESLVRPVLEAHQGRKVKSMGDGLLIEFPNALDAVECGVDLQRHIHERNALPGSPPLRLRVGIHLGDVQEVGVDIFGDAVNIASRIEPLADPGGVCLSEPVFVQVRNKVPYQLVKLGPRALKGVREPMEIYEVVLPWIGREVVTGGPAPARLAVLPLANISPDPKDEYFADGLTEELINVLSQLHDLRVIARTSVLPYKAAPKPISQMGAELGVSSILEGSVRKVGDQLRITVQLIDVSSQEHRWSEAYDRKLDDVFAIQTDVAKRVAKALKVRLRKGEEARLEQRPKVRPESYLAYLRGRALLSNRSKENSDAAKKEFELAASLDPKNASAYAGLADVTHILGEVFAQAPWPTWDREGKVLALRALELDPDLADAHTALGGFLWHEFDFVGAENEFKVAISLNPSYSFAHYLFSNLLEDQDRVEEALNELELAEESDPNSQVILSRHALVLIWLRRFDEAKNILEKLGRLGPTDPFNRWVSSLYYVARSDLPSALHEIDRANEIEPGVWWDDYVYLFALSGEKDKAKKLLEEHERKTASASPPAVLARCHAILGDRDECFRLLETALERHEFHPRMWRREPTLQSVVSDPRFAHLLKRMNLS